MVAGSWAIVYAMELLVGEGGQRENGAGQVGSSSAGLLGVQVEGRAGRGWAREALIRAFNSPGVPALLHVPRLPKLGNEVLAKEK